MSSVEKEQKGITRRDFVKGAAAGGVAGLVVGGGGAALLMPKAEPKPWLPDKWDKEADVVIVGAGGAAMAAAIEAREANATVILLEKAAQAGGTTALSGGIIQGSGTDLQKALGIPNDNANLHYEYWTQAAEGLVDPALVRILADNSGPNIKWMEAHGAKYESLSGVNPIAYITKPGLMVNRIHRLQGIPTDKTGGWLMAQILFAAAQKLGATFLYETPVKVLLRDPEKGVVGVQAESGGKPLFVKAKKAVILAAGSFDWNKDMARSFSGQQLWALETGVCRCAPTNTGDGMKLGMALGADLAGLGGTIGSIGTAIGTGAANRIGIWVNKQGLRFINEGSHYAYAMRAVYNQQEHWAWAIFDENMKKDGGPASMGWSADMSKEIADGKVKTAPTVKALAEAIGVNATQLEETIAKWNKDAAAGQDTLFGKLKDAVKPLSTSPFYATRVVESNLGAQGGVKIDTGCHVIDVNGKAIARLYAAGMVAGGFIGPYYPGSGTALASTVCFGRIAGKNAAAETPSA